MRIDAHQHFWRYSADEYPWIDESLRALQRDYLPADFAPLLARNDINGSIAVQARMSLRETEWLLGLADGEPLIKGVIGWVPLANETVAGDLERFCAHPRFKGVRHVVQGLPAGFFDAASFNRGIGEVGARGLLYELLIDPDQLPEASPGSSA